MKTKIGTHFRPKFFTCAPKISSHVNDTAKYIKNYMETKKILKKNGKKIQKRKKLPSTLDPRQKPTLCKMMTSSALLRIQIYFVVYLLQITLQTHAQV